MVRSVFRLILETQPDITVAAEAPDGTQAVTLARRLRPDVCLVDIRMPGLDGIEVTRALAGPGVADPLRVVIVTTFDTDEYVYGAARRRGGHPAERCRARPSHRSRPGRRRR
jgi:DNA-binding NarL/FixJ family response regulator